MTATATLLVTCRRLPKRPRKISWRTRCVSTTTANNNHNHNQDNVVETPVAIIGGGPSGLLLSNLLSLYQVPSILVDGKSVEERCRHPQAHFLNTRTMEILRQLPSIYHRVQDQMTPVHQWQHFQFGYNMLPTTALARVHHPVDRPLQAKQEANGSLVTKDNTNINHHDNKSRPLSACSVGHLAQHTFCRILYDAAMEQALPQTRLNYNTRVNKIHNNDEGFHIETSTDNNDSSNTTTTIQSKVCVAADGAHSFCRTKAWQIGHVGQVGIQYLINIHVKTNPEWARHYLHENNGNFAMLYSVLHPEIVAMIVCHSIGEYVFQVPFFPPYQSLELDYPPERIRQMVCHAMGIPIDDDDEASRILEQAQLEVVSVNAWTMSSLIADRYYHHSPSDDNNHNNGGGGGGVGYLVGDATHIFPPAGGLGMNTGMQDVYSLAWKLSWAYHNGHLSSSSSSSSTSVLQDIGKSYQTERRPVAQANAALSVRNYNRLLEIYKACYLSEQHPALLVKALEASSPLVPLEARREVFQRLFATATWTLSSLKNVQHPYTQHLRNNIQRILAQGGGLPLLFPQAELGFGYPTKSNDETTGDDNNSNKSRQQKSDTMGFTPQIRVGHLFPHVEVAVSIDALQRFPHLKPINDDADRGVSLLSLSDLPAQVSRHAKPCMVLLWISTESKPGIDPAILEAQTSLSQVLGMTVEVVIAMPDLSSSEEPNNQTQQQKVGDEQLLVLKEIPHPVEGSLLDQYQETLWLIRPDGHVAGGLKTNNVELQGTSLHSSLLDFALEALFGFPRTKVQ